MGATMQGKVRRGKCGWIGMSSKLNDFLPVTIRIETYRGFAQVKYHLAVSIALLFGLLHDQAETGNRGSKSQIQMRLLIINRLIMDL